MLIANVKLELSECAESLSGHSITQFGENVSKGAKQVLAQC